MTEEERQKVRDGFSNKPMVNSRDPNVVVRTGTPPAERVLSFPADVAVGRIAIRKWKETSQLWQYLEAAKGEVRIPANMEIQLEISKDVTDLGFLAAMQDERDETMLYSLILSGAAINDTSMEGVSKLRTLYALEMIQTNVTTAGMNKLITMRGLENLKIDGTKIPNDGLEVLKELINLERIEIYNAPNLTVGVVPIFKQMRMLRRLHLENTGITQDQLRQMDKDMPTCAITPFQ